MTSSSERYFVYREDDQHYTVVDADDVNLGSVTEVDGGWRAYSTSGDELPGGEVYLSQHAAGEALAAHVAPEESGEDAGS